MITGITSARFWVQSKNNFQSNISRPVYYTNFNLKADSVCFSGKTPAVNIIEHTINLAFKKVQDAPANPVLRKYLGVTKDNINVCIQETDLGKNAILTLTNLQNSDKNYALYELRRVSGSIPKIISLEDLTVEKDLKTIENIKNILEDLK